MHTKITEIDNALTSYAVSDLLCLFNGCQRSTNAGNGDEDVKFLA